MSILSDAWRKVFPKRHEFGLHVQADKNGNWRWHMAGDDGTRMTLMTGLSRDYQEVLDEVLRVQRGKFYVVVHVPRK